MWICSSHSFLQTFNSLCCFTLFTRLHTAIHQGFVWQCSTLIIIICDAKVISYDGYSVYFYAAFGVNKILESYFPTIGMCNLFFFFLQLCLRCDLRLEWRLRGPIREEWENGCEANCWKAVQEEGTLKAAHHRGTMRQTFCLIIINT